VVKNLPRAPKQNELILQSLIAFNDPWTFVFNDPSTLHDLRRILVTCLSASGVPAAEIDRFIGKRVSEGAASHAAYDFAPKLIEKNALLTNGAAL
jgi:hypothetical protein